MVSKGRKLQLVSSRIPHYLRNVAHLDDAIFPLSNLLHTTICLAFFPWRIASLNPISVASHLSTTSTLAFVWYCSILCTIPFIYEVLIKPSSPSPRQRQSLQSAHSFYCKLSHDTTLITRIDVLLLLISTLKSTDSPRVVTLATSDELNSLSWNNSHKSWR